MKSPRLLILSIGPNFYFYFLISIFSMLSLVKLYSLEPSERFSVSFSFWLMQLPLLAGEPKGGVSAGFRNHPTNQQTLLGQSLCTMLLQPFVGLFISYTHTYTYMHPRVHAHSHIRHTHIYNTCARPFLSSCCLFFAYFYSWCSALFFFLIGSSTASFGRTDFFLFFQLLYRCIASISQFSHEPPEFLTTGTSSQLHDSFPKISFHKTVFPEISFCIVIFRRQEMNEKLDTQEKRKMMI